MLSLPLKGSTYPSQWAAEGSQARIHKLSQVFSKCLLPAEGLFLTSYSSQSIKFQVKNIYKQEKIKTDFALCIKILSVEFSKTNREKYFNSVHFKSEQVSLRSIIY